MIKVLSNEDIEHHIQQAAEQGTSMAMLARNLGLPVTKLYYLRRRLQKKEISQKNNSPKLVRLIPKPTSKQPAEEKISLEFGDIKLCIMSAEILPEVLRTILTIHRAL